MNLDVRAIQIKETLRIEFEIQFGVCVWACRRYQKEYILNVYVYNSLSLDKRLYRKWIMREGIINNETATKNDAIQHWYR